ncbi:molybdenum cofactor guanylyltransferase [Lentibacillus cibarius]|uniref:Probable molybdenum cofactor guanylyltransferase n=1 Tax=Lentibacillus cibarius TaxID=2583219 RepID=A0A5S3QPK1_9BACI|nr:molybdenum cofactor guanylyltransferase [Lentibacillus cibarius]TMN23695.1 molybdenum cofactor guanylyltransferase [Lentibacillus cibarius]
MQISGIILAGGQSSRMGTNKSLLGINGKPAIAHINDELSHFCHYRAVISNDPAPYAFLGTDIYCDRYKHKGPLAGIEAGLYHSSNDICAFAACDTPLINRKVYRLLLDAMDSYDHDAVIPVYNEKMHPLSGIYQKRVLPEVENLLEKDQRKVRTLFEHINVRYVSNYEGIDDYLLLKHFFNMNYPHQYEKAKHL